MFTIKGSPRRAGGTMATKRPGYLRTFVDGSGVFEQRSHSTKDMPAECLELLDRRGTCYIRDARPYGKLPVRLFFDWPRWTKHGERRKCKYENRLIAFRRKAEEYGEIVREWSRDCRGRLFLQIAVSHGQFEAMRADWLIGAHVATA